MQGKVKRKRNGGVNDGGWATKRARKAAAEAAAAASAAAAAADGASPPGTASASDGGQGAAGLPAKSQAPLQDSCSPATDPLNNKPGDTKGLKQPLLY